MSDLLSDYTQVIAGLLRQPEVRDRAVADAQRVGQERIDQALVMQRRNAESADRALRLADQAQSSFRRLESRTGAVEALPAEDVPQDLEALPRYLDELIRDLDAAEKAQQWVERSRARQAQDDSAGSHAKRQAEVTPDAVPAVPAGPSVPGRRPDSSKTRLVVGATAAVAVIAIILFLLLR